MTSKQGAKFQLWAQGAGDRDEIPQFGEQMKDEFSLAFHEIVFCNQGSYGVCPKRVVQYKHDLVDEMEASPDYWFRKVFSAKSDEARRQLANFLGADPDHIVFVPNATTGVNTVLKSLQLQPEEEILHNNHTYLAVKNTVDATVTKYDADILSLDLTFPIESEQEIVDLYAQVCQRNRSIRLAVVDHISSPSGIQFPIKRIAEELHKYGVLVMVDGAHAPGQIPLNMNELAEAGIDFYTGNLHKWLFTPRGCGFLWVHPRHHPVIRPLVTSNIYKKSFVEDFKLAGTDDYSNYLASEAALAFFNALGGFERIHSYVVPLLEWARDMIGEALGTMKLPIPASMESPYLKVVGLPNLPDGRENCFDTAEQLIKEIMVEHNVVIQVACFQGQLWTRISGSIYSTKEDFFKLRDALKSKFNVK